MQTLVVTLIVLGAAAYALWYWMPTAWRRTLAGRLASRSQGLAQAVASAPGCSACASCKGCGSQTPSAVTTPSDH